MDPTGRGLRRLDMPRRARVDWDAVAAAAPDKLILVRTLLEIGVPSSTIAYRCRKAGGMWWHPLLGLVALTRSGNEIVLAQHHAAADFFGGQGRKNATRC